MCRLLPLALLAFILCACNQATAPTSPITEPDSPGVQDQSRSDYDPIDDFLREGAGVIDGDVTLNGSTETDPNYDTSPYAMTQPAKTGDIAIFRVKGKLSDNSPTTLYTKQSSPSKNYSSFSVPGTNVDQYKAMYVTGTEPLSITFYNSTSYNMPLNAKAAIFDYNFKTQAAENAGEPNDDDNGATITDRSLANNLVSGVTATRSVFSFDPATRDVEEWYKTTIGILGEQFSFKYATTSGRFGTWSYTLKVFDPNGVQMGSTVNVPAGNAAATVTRTSTMAGTYYLQMVGTPVTKNNTNVYYNLYTMTACVKPRLLQLSRSPENACPGTPLNWNVTSANGVTSYSWNFGGGCTPNTSTAASPIVMAGAEGLYPLTLTLTNGCDSTVINQQYLVGCEGDVGLQSGVGSQAMVADLLVDPDGTTHVLTQYSGTVDINPSGETSIQTSTGNGLVLTRLDASGDMKGFAAFPAPLNKNITAEGLAYNSTHGYAISGRYAGVIDFDPGPGVVSRDSDITGTTFLLGLDANRNFKYVSCFGPGSTPADPIMDPGSGQVFLPGSYSGTVDFDPGPSVFSRTAIGDTDSYCILFDTAGRLVNGAVWGGLPNETVYGGAITSGALLLTGSFGSGTIDADPGPGTTNLTSVGGTSAGYITRLTPDGAMLLDNYYLITGGTVLTQAGIHLSDSGSSVYVAGMFRDTVDFNQGGGVANRTSQGDFDVFVLSLLPNLSYDWVYVLGGAGPDGIGDLAVLPGTDSVLAYGSFEGPVDFDPSAGVDTRNGTSAPYVLGIDGAGFRLFASTDWDGPFVVTSSLGVDAAGTSRCGGYYQGLMDFQPGTGNTFVPSVGTLDGFIQRLQPDGTW